MPVETIGLLVEIIGTTFPFFLSYHKIKNRPELKESWSCKSMVPLMVVSRSTARCVARFQC